MAQYRVKALLEVEIRVEADSVESALDEVATLVFGGFSKPISIRTLKIKRTDVQEER